MKTLKTILALLLALILALSLAACGGSGPGKSKKDDGPYEEDGSGGEDEDGGRSRREAYGLYIKDGEIYCSGLSKGDAWQVTRRFYEDAGNSDLASASFSYTTVMSRDGGTLFFPDKIDGGGYTLYCRDMSGEEDAVKIDSDITLYTVNDDASLVTYLKTGSLYRYDVGRDEKEKLDSDVYSLYVSGDGRKLLYRDGDATLYQLDYGRDREKLDSGVDNIWAVSGDCETIVYQKDNALYLMRDGGEKLRIASEVSNTIRAYDTGEAYFVKEDGGVSTLYYFDGEMSEAVTDEFRDYWTNNFYPAYDTAMLAYQDDGGEYWLAVGVEPMELGAGNPEPISFTFSEDGESFWYVDEPYNGEGELYQITVSDGRAEKAVLADEDVYISIGHASGRLVYFKDVSGSEGELYVDGEYVDDDVYLYNLQWSEDGALLYYEDYSANEGCGTLMQYSGGKVREIADDVYDACYLPDGSVLYLMDYSTGRCYGDLYVYSGGESTKLDEDVVAILPVSSSGHGYGYYW